MNKSYDLRNGDCIKVLNTFEDGWVDLTVTSPPYDNLRNYNGNNDLWNEGVWKGVIKELYRVTKEGGIVVWIVSDATINGSETGTSFKQALWAKEVGFNLYDTMIWNKPSPQAPTEGRYYDVFEYMFIFSRDKPKTLNLLDDRKNKTAGGTSNKETRSCRENRRILSEKRTTKEFSRRFNVWDISRGRNSTAHPAVFPLQLATDHILSWSQENEIVLDPFMGSGTTGIACLNTNRKFIGIELDKTYFELAKNRIENHKPQMELF